MAATEPTGTPEYTSPERTDLGGAADLLDSRARARIEEGEAAAVWVDRSSLKPWDRNPRNNEAAVAKVAASIQRFGFGNPILARRADREVIAGHTRLLAAEALGIARVPVRFLDLDPADAHLLAVADNKLGEIAEWDDDELAKIMSAYSAEDAELAGFDDDELEQLAERLKDDPPSGDDDADLTPPAKPLSVPGEVYELGPHRLVCGDAREDASWAQLLGTERADLVVTSPPYNQKLDGFKPSGMMKENPAWVERMAGSYADSKPEPDYQAEQVNVLALAAKYTSTLASVFYNHKHRYRDKTVLSPLEWIWRSCWKLRQEIVWDRSGSITLNARMLMPQDERIYWLFKGDDFFFDDTTEFKTWGTIWEIAPRVEIKESAPFPVELPERCIQGWSKLGDIVVDPYGGTGTTLIAAAKHGRQARLMELSPGYCDVIRRRWGAFARSAGVEPGPGAL